MGRTLNCVLLAGVSLWAAPLPGQTVSYDIVYVRQPRYGNGTNTIWPEVAHPARAEPGADLVLLHPNGSQEILVDCTVCSVTDPFVSFDGQWVYYSLFHDLTQVNSSRGNLPLLGADIFRLHLPTRYRQQLTFGEFTPNTGAGHWDESNPLDPPTEFNRLGYGVLNLGPCPVPGGKVAFTSNRNAFWPTGDLTAPTLQLFVMDEDGSNVIPIGAMNVNSALHPTILQDGRLLYSTYESQGTRDGRLWGIWSIYPDGRHWEPVVSAFHHFNAFHFMTQLTNGDVVVDDYYNLNNNGFGSLYRFPVRPPPGVPPFHSAFPSENPPIEFTTDGGLQSFRMPFTPRGLHSITPFTHHKDQAAPVGGGGARVGKLAHPSAAPDNDLLVVWTPGPANDGMAPYYDSGIYLMPDGDTVWSPDALVPIENSPSYNEAWPRAVVPYQLVHGVPEPVELPFLPNDGGAHSELPAGTAYGLVGTSSFYKRESFPGEGSASFGGLDAFNTSQNGASSNWSWQGADAGRYGDDEIWAVRILGMEPNTHRSYGPNAGTHFSSHARERLRILGEIPLRKVDAQGQPILDPEGNPDTSFLAKLPADTPFTFQTLDRDGLVLNMAQTWHQLRPGEVRTDCGGCHAHSQQPLDFDQTAAAAPGYAIYDLAEITPLLTRDSQGEPDLQIVDSALVNVEFYRDIRPILQRSCVTCHTRFASPVPGRLVLDDYALYDGLPGDYKRLAEDRDAQWGYPPVISTGTWRQTNASRYVRKFQSRRSLLIWKLFGRRLDGWQNADHPTESVPGVPSTLPPGADPNDADLDFTGQLMPPPGSGAPPLTTEERMLFARWVDLGAPIDTGYGTPDEPFGWMLDDLKPTLTVSEPRGGFQEHVQVFRFGIADAYTGVDIATLSVTASFVVGGRPPGAELRDLAGEVTPGVYEIVLPQPLPPLVGGHLRVEVADGQGNITRVDRRFDTAEPIFTDDFESGDTRRWSNTAGGS